MESSICNLPYAKDIVVPNVKILADCETSFQIQNCYSDSDCNSLNVGCDLINQVCKVPYTSQVKNYAQCVLSKLDSSIVIRNFLSNLPYKVILYCKY